MSLLSGWAPPDNAEYIEVLPPVQNPICHRKSNHVPSAGTGSTSTLTIFPLELDQQDGCTGFASATAMGDNKHTDPNWVARPRNKFILFRCDYVRKHSRDGKHGRRSSGSEIEKSLSKQAAEAWHRLSKEERLYWKECAATERIEHAKRYPNYRYQPKKNATRRRQVRSPKNNPEESKTIAQPVNPRPQSPSGSPINRSPPKHMLSVIKPMPRRMSYVPRFAVGDSPNKRLRPSVSLPSMTGAASSPNIQDIGSPCNQYTPTTMTLSSRLQMPMPSPSFNTPELLSPNNFLAHRRPSIASTSSSTSSLSNWNGENMTYFCGSGSASDVSMSDGLSQIPLSNFDLGLEMAALDNNTGTNERIMHEYITGEMQFTPPPSSLHHHHQQQQQQQLIDDGLYQATGDLWNTHLDSGAQMAIASQVDFNNTHSYAQNTIRGCAHAATLASSTPSIPNGFYETMAFSEGGGP
ncbi:hypothetical protein BYT27DRAFT_7209651 [Phlegmacium glaucopus]|nr:hypothetical protein BYT27DRAFT_7209651 [Phlegmacium glaucopus]